MTKIDPAKSSLINQELIKNYSTKLMRDPLKLKSDDWHETAHMWYVTINGVGLEYYTGLGHRVELKYYSGDGRNSYKELKNKNLSQFGFEQLLIVSKAVPPKIDDVVHGLIMDSEARRMPFDEWCESFGYDTDSRKAFKMYEACLENEKKLRAMNLGTLNELAELFQDY
jgi:hypothetical protein